MQQACLYARWFCCYQYGHKSLTFLKTAFFSNTYPMEYPVFKLLDISDSPYIIQEWVPFIKPHWFSSWHLWNLTKISLRIVHEEKTLFTSLHTKKVQINFSFKNAFPSYMQKYFEYSKCLLDCKLQCCTNTLTLCYRDPCGELMSLLSSH